MPDLPAHPYDRPTDPAKRHSTALTDGPDRAAARAMLKAIGFTDDDLAKPLVGVATTWIETMPCNYNQRRLADFVKEGIRAAGGTPMEFNTISGQRRRVDGHGGDEGEPRSAARSSPTRSSWSPAATCSTALVCLVGCDKTIPGAAMALGRPRHPRRRPLQRHDLPGHLQGQAQRDRGDGRSRRSAPTGPARSRLEELYEVENVACPGPGACGGQFTANTMSTVMEFLGLSPAGLNGIPAEDPAKDEAARRTGELVMDLVRRDVRPSTHRDPRRARERDRLGRRDRRLDQRRAPPAGDRPRVRDRARHRRVRRRSPTGPRSSPTCSRAAATRRPTSTTPAASPWSCASCSSATCSTATRRRSTGGRSPRSPRGRRRRPARRSSSRSSDRSSRSAA